MNTYLMGEISSQITLIFGNYPFLIMFPILKMQLAGQQKLKS